VPDAAPQNLLHPQHFILRELHISLNQPPLSSTFPGPRHRLARVIMGQNAQAELNRKTLWFPSESPESLCMILPEPSFHDRDDS